MSQQPLRLIWMRHGETAWNTEQRVQGHLDIPLNQEGQRQARCLALHWSQQPTDMWPTALYASHLLRARQTGLPIAWVLGLPLQVESGLEERRMGRLQGYTRRQQADLMPEIVAGLNRRESHVCPAGGETPDELRDRVVRLVSRLAQRHEGQGRIAVISHGGVLDMAYRLAQGIGWTAPRAWSIPNAGINEFEVQSGELRLIRWGETDHLQADVSLQAAGADF